MENTRSCRARAPCRTGCVRAAECVTAPAKDHLSFGARPWYDVRAAASNGEPAVRVARAHRRHCAGCLARGGETRELDAQARGGPRWFRPIGLRDLSRALRVSEGLSPAVHKLVVRRASCDLQHAQPAFAWPTRISATALAVSREVATHASLPRARAVPRWLRYSAHARIRSGSSPAEGLSPSAQGRGATCELWPPTRSRRSRGSRTRRHCAGCLAGGGETHELAARALRRGALALRSSGLRT